MPKPASISSDAPVLVVAEDGTGDFRSIQKAIDAVPEQSVQRHVIHIRAGTYPGPIRVPRSKPRVTFRGDDARATVLTGNLTARMAGSDGVELGTFRTPTVYIDADDFRAERITFANTAGEGGQAIALSLSGDRSVLRSCRIVGWQDTLYLERGRHLVQDSYIDGHCDFIFGAATAVFDRCHLHCKTCNYITAASTPEDQRYGLVFLDCRISTDTDKPSTHLGRPWRPAAHTAYIRCHLGPHIKPDGWHNWKKPDNEKTARYMEYASSGPGASALGQRVKWSRQLSNEEASGFTIDTILRGADAWRASFDAE